MLKKQLAEISELGKKQIEKQEKNFQQCFLI